MSSIGDKTSFYFNRAVELLFLSQPTRTSMGIILGVILNGLLSLFEPILVDYHFINIQSLKPWHLIAFGVLVANIRSFFRAFRKQSIDDENIDKVFQLIQDGNFSKFRKEATTSFVVGSCCG